MIVDLLSTRPHRARPVPEHVIAAASQAALERARELAAQGIAPKLISRRGEPLCVVYRTATA